MPRILIALGIFLILAGIAVASYVGLNGPKDMATGAQTVLSVLFISGPGLLLTMAGAIWHGRVRSKTLP